MYFSTNLQDVFVLCTNLHNSVQLLAGAGFSSTSSSFGSYLHCSLSVVGILPAGAVIPDESVVWVCSTSIFWSMIGVLSIKVRMGTRFVPPCSTPPSSAVITTAVIVTISCAKGSPIVMSHTISTIRPLALPDSQDIISFCSTHSE